MTIKEPIGDNLTLIEKVGITKNRNFDKREAQILLRIKRHYGKKLGRRIGDKESAEIATNLLSLAKTIYGA